MASFSVHFDGDITIDHKVSVRVLGNTYQRMQRTIDRAYLLDKYGVVEKYERLTKAEYRETDFIAAYPEEGGIILSAVKQGAELVVDRIYAATSVVFQSAVDHAFVQHQSLAEQLIDRRIYANQMGDRARSFADVQAAPPPEWSPAYSNRSIVKEVDQLVSQITRSDLVTSTVDLTLHGSKPFLPLAFTPLTAKNFHKIASDRELGPPMIARAQIRILDAGNPTTKPSAKILNLDTLREVNLHLSNDLDFAALHPYHNGDDEVRLHVCPILEAKGFDLNGGDLMFLGVA